VTLDLGFTTFRLELPTPSIFIEVWNALHPRPLGLALRVELAPHVYINRTVTVYVNSTPQVLRVVSGGAYTLTFEPQAPGIYAVSASLWCMSANATAYSVVVRGVRLGADKASTFAGEPTRLELSAEWWPAQAPSPPVNVTLSGCGDRRLTVTPGTLELKYNKQSTPTATASAANATAAAEVEVGCLNIVPHLHPIGFANGAPVLTDPSQIAWWQEIAMGRH